MFVGGTGEGFHGRGGVDQALVGSEWHVNSGGSTRRRRRGGGVGRDSVGVSRILSMMNYEGLRRGYCGSVLVGSAVAGNKGHLRR